MSLVVVAVAMAVAMAVSMVLHPSRGVVFAPLPGGVPPSRGVVFAPLPILSYSALCGFPHGRLTQLSDKLEAPLIG